MENEKLGAIAALIATLICLNKVSRSYEISAENLGKQVHNFTLDILSPNNFEHKGYDDGQPVIALLKNDSPPLNKGCYKPSKRIKRILERLENIIV